MGPRDELVASLGRVTCDGMLRVWGLLLLWVLAWLEAGRLFGRAVSVLRLVASFGLEPETSCLFAASLGRWLGASRLFGPCRV